MDTRAMSKVKMGYEAIDASSSHQEDDTMRLHVCDGIIDDLLTYGACARRGVTEREGTWLKVNGDLDEMSRTRDLGVCGEGCVVTGHQVQCPGSLLGRQ